MSWLIILEVILEILSEKQNRQNLSAAEVKECCKNMGPLQKLVFERQLRMGLEMTPRQWRRDSDEILSAVYTNLEGATDEGLDMLIAEARNLD